MRYFTATAAIMACVLAGSALGVSLTREGPPGPPGPRGPGGQSGKVAQADRLGVCWTAPPFTQYWENGSSSTWVGAVSIDPPQVSNGVYVCPPGETFTSIVPHPAQ